MPAQLQDLRSNAAALKFVQNNVPSLHKDCAALNSTSSSLFSSSSKEAELCNKLETLFYTSLRTGDDESARTCLQALTKRFGSSNERVMALKGVLQESTARSNEELGKVLNEYDEIIIQNPTNLAISKRRVAVLKSLDRPADAAKALVQLLEVSPTDLEAWVELADIYSLLSMFPQAIHCLEEALLIAPNAWNSHARIGELLYMSAVSGASDTLATPQALLTNSVRRFCRSIELCDGYYRGYHGLKMSTDKLLQLPKRENKPTGQDNETISSTVLQELNRRAVEELAKLAPAKG